jgi:hypothetical protein
MHHGRAVLSLLEHRAPNQTYPNEPFSSLSEYSKELRSNNLPIALEGVPFLGFLSENLLS